MKNFFRGRLSFKKVCLVCLFSIFQAQAGSDSPQIPPAEFQSLKLAADKRDTKAQSNLGTMYYSGDGVAQNLGEAFRYTKLAADHGDAEAQCRLGLMYYSGEGAEKNLAEAFKYFKLAADQGYAGAQHHVAVMYYAGEGVAQNLEEASRYYKLYLPSVAQDLERFT